MKSSAKNYYVTYWLNNIVVAFINTIRKKFLNLTSIVLKD